MHYLRKIIATLCICTAVVVGGLITVLFFPQRLFATGFTHGDFNVYGTASSEALIAVLDDAYRLARTSELYDGKSFEVFIAHGHVLNKLDDLQGKGPIARATAGNILIKIPVDFSQRDVHTPMSRVHVTELLVHEIVHVLQGRRYGLLKFNPFFPPQYWILEGYPEYVARQDRRNDAYSLKEEVKRFASIAETQGDRLGWMEAVPGHFMPYYYLKGRIMVEYLMDVKGLTYDEIVRQNPDEHLITEELLTWAFSEDQ